MVFENVWESWVYFFFEIKSDPVLSCKIRLDRDPEAGSCANTDANLLPRVDHSLNRPSPRIRHLVQRALNAEACAAT